MAPSELLCFRHPWTLTPLILNSILSQLLKMLPLKRKREHKEEFTSSGGFSDPGSENDAWTTDNEASDFEAEIDFLQDAISKRNAKDGTIFLKKASNAKGKAKAKRELGGGSFQSMGMSINVQAR